MAHQVTAGRFVGRTQELARLGQLLASSLVAPIGGAAVIGKTRLGDSWPPPATSTDVVALRVSRLWLPPA